MCLINNDFIIKTENQPINQSINPSKRNKQAGKLTNKMRAKLFFVKHVIIERQEEKKKKQNKTKQNKTKQTIHQQFPVQLVMILIQMTELYMSHLTINLKIKIQSTHSRRSFHQLSNKQTSKQTATILFSLPLTALHPFFG